MWNVMILTLSLLASVNTYTPRQQDSVASESQIRNAIENKYDDTGPGAKGREYAYYTYKTLENALVGYLDDPDTKLPDHEREKALRVLESQNSYRPKRPFPSTVEFNAYTKQAPQSFGQWTVPSKPTAQIPASNYGSLDLEGFQVNDIPQSYQALKQTPSDGFSFQKFRAVKNPVSSAHYSKGFGGSQVVDQFDPNPQYSFSYGVHDQRTGDTKSAQESRSDGVVRGFYSFVDADGELRTVHYTADDAQGFKALVQRTRTQRSQTL